MPRDDFRCCALNDAQGKRWFVYYDRQRSTMVVTDGMTLLYEKVMSTSERIAFAGNVSESILEDAWIETVVRRLLHISEQSEDKLTLVHIVYKVEMNRVWNADVQMRTVDLLEKAVKAHSRLLDRYTRNRAPIPVQMAARKTMPSQPVQRETLERHENGSATDPSKRRRTRATGLDFDGQ